MNQVFPENEVIVDVQGGVAVVTLNRPALLNALSLEMIRQISAYLARWENDDSVQAIFFKGAGDRAFCAGGDIKSFYYAGMDYRRGLVGAGVPALFFAEEYALDKQVFHTKKPIIAFMNGITMGGGYGVAGHSALRIATDKTVFAMPEVGIGFYPDVGSLFHLVKAPRFFGHYLALTGQSIAGADMALAGLADLYIPAEREAEAVEALKTAKTGDFRGALQGLSAPPSLEGSIFEKHGACIERAFSKVEVPEILEALAQENTPFSLATAQILRDRSPMSVLVTAAYLQRAAQMSFDDIIAMDFVVTQNFINGLDFYEGVRATLIDKDRTPRWATARPEDVQSYFTNGAYNLKDVQIF